MGPVLIIGCGDIGQRVGALWRVRGVAVHALRRTAPPADAPDFRWEAADLDAPPAPRAVGGRILYYFAPPAPQGVEDVRLRRFLASLRGAPARVVYISTTGVYGDCGGAWIDETRPPAPGNARSRRRLDAEQALTAWCDTHTAPLTILRVGGIYGPGRLPIARLQRGEPAVREHEAPWSNRIHAGDLAAACLAAAEGPPGVYNATDGHPGTLTEYLNAAADALGLPRPPQIPLAEAIERASPALREYLTESRRIDNRKLLHGLSVELRYPSLADGLRAL